MDHQDWNPVVLNNTTTKQKQVSINKRVSQKASDDTLKVIAPPNLGKLMAQARGNKTRKNICHQIL